MNTNWIIFLRFLKENHIYCQYRGNIFINRSYEFVTRFLMSANPMNFMNYAFCWRDTTEGDEFWTKWNSRWINFYNNIK